MLFHTKKNKYLTENNQLTSNYEEAVLVEEEMISSILSRFKIDNKYLGCLDNTVKLTTKDDDSTLFVFKNDKYISVNGLCLSLDDRLCYMDSDVSDLNTNLYFEYLTEEETLYFKFKKSGLVIWKGNLSEEELSLSREKILKNENDRIGDLFSEDPELFSKFLKDETLKYILNRILKEYHLTTFSSNTLRKDDGNKIFFHVDYPYHNLTPPYSNKILGIQVIYALNDFTIENGATMYIPYSFNSPKFPFFFGQQKVEYMLVPKGSIILYRGDIWHSQGVNNTAEPRIALLANFSPLEIPAKDNVVDQVKRLKLDFEIIDEKVHI